MERRKRMERRYMDDYKGISETVKAATVFQQLLFLMSAGFLPVFSSTSFSSSTLLAFLLRPWEFSFVAPLFRVFFWLVACSVSFFILVLLEILLLFSESLTENRSGKCEYVIDRNNGRSIILLKLRLVRKDLFQMRWKSTRERRSRESESWARNCVASHNQLARQINFCFFVHGNIHIVRCRGGLFRGFVRAGVLKVKLFRSKFSY